MSKQSTNGLAVQVFAGAMAAIVAALIGSRIGVAGTVLGAGVASVLTTLGAALYQRMHARVADRGPRWAPLAAAGVIAFGLGLVLITGLEWARGEPLSGGRGTTIGSIVRSDPGTGEKTRPAEIAPTQPGSIPTVTDSSQPGSTTVETTTNPPPTSTITTSPPTTSGPPATSTTGAQPPLSGSG